MKKAILFLCLSSFTALVAAASDDLRIQQQQQMDPIKGGIPKGSSSFELSKGYFSWFEMLTSPVCSPKVDSTKHNTSPAPTQSQMQSPTTFNARKSVQNH